MILKSAEMLKFFSTSTRRMVNKFYNKPKIQKNYKEPVQQTAVHKAISCFYVAFFVLSVACRGC